MDVTRILTADEVRKVLANLRYKQVPNAKLNQTIFRLSCCCGLRVKEIVGLNVSDFIFVGPKPCVRVRRAITKGQESKRRARVVPLWWDKGTLDDLRAWHASRIEAGAQPDDPFVCGVSRVNSGKRLTTTLARKKWKTAIKSLGSERVSQLGIHSGRRSFCSHALSVGRSLIEVRDAAGHSNVSTTSIYLYALERPDIPDIFGE